MNQTRYLADLVLGIVDDCLKFSEPFFFFFNELTLSLDCGDLFFQPLVVFCLLEHLCIEALAEGFNGEFIEGFGLRGIVVSLVLASRYSVRVLCCAVACVVRCKSCGGCSSDFISGKLRPDLANLLVLLWPTLGGHSCGDSGATRTMSKSSRRGRLVNWCNGGGWGCECGSIRRVPGCTGSRVSARIRD